LKRLHQHGLHLAMAVLVSALLFDPLPAVVIAL
jgi:hypothetical protein